MSFRKRIATITEKVADVAVVAVPIIIGVGVAVAWLPVPIGFSATVVSESQLPGNVYSIKVTPNVYSIKATPDNQRVYELHVPDSSSPAVKSLDEMIAPGTVVRIGPFGGLFNGPRKNFSYETPTTVPPEKIRLHGRSR